MGWDYGPRPTRERPMNGYEQKALPDPPHLQNEDGETMEPPPGYEEIDKVAVEYFKTCGPWTYEETKKRWNGE